MIKVIYGEKGTGKTKVMVDTANALSSKNAGDVVFIDDSNQLIYDLKHKIRFINITEYPVVDPLELMGFICGIIAQDYDVEGIFIDGLTYILKKKAEDLEEFFNKLESTSEGFKVDFYISISGQKESAPDFIKKYF